MTAFQKIDLNIMTWPTMIESAEWYKNKAINSFKRRHNKPCFGGNSRDDARYSLMDAKRIRKKVILAGDRAYKDPW